MMNLDVGLVGAGRIGHFVGLNLLKAGCSLHVFDINPAAAESLLQHDATWHNTPASVAAAAQFIILSVVNSDDVQNVISGPDGICNHDLTGKYIIDTTTIPPADARRYAAATAERGGQYLDAPITGGEGGAASGTLTIMVGGDEHAFAQCQPVFTIIGDRVTYLGPSGSGQVVKMANQAIMATAFVTIAENIRVLESSDVDMAAALEILTIGGARSAIMEGMARLYRQLADGEHDPAKTRHYSQLFEKDVRYALARAEEAGQPFAMLRQVYEVLHRVNQTETYTITFPLNIMKCLRDPAALERRSGPP